MQKFINTLTGITSGIACVATAVAVTLLATCISKDCLKSLRVGKVTVIAEKKVAPKTKVSKKKAAPTESTDTVKEESK